MAAYGDVFMIPLAAEHRDAAGVAAGDEVEVDLELDAEPREVTVPPDLAEALAREPDAERFFGGLSYSNRRRIVLSIEDAKTPETRQRRVSRSVELLREGRT